MAGRAAQHQTVAKNYNYAPFDILLKVYLQKELLLWRRYISTQDFRCTSRWVMAWYFLRKSFSESVDPRRSVGSRVRSVWNR